MKWEHAAAPGTSIPAEQPRECPVCGTEVRNAVPRGEVPCPSCGHLLWFTSEQVGDVTIVSLSDNRVAVMEMLDLLDRALLDGALIKLILDFHGIQQVSSAALGKLVKLVTHAGRVQGSLSLCDLHPDMRQVFKITRLDRIFTLHDTREEALAAFHVDD
jgi:anti-sigma B factor antagonist